jgi:hypothetical protein
VVGVVWWIIIGEVVIFFFFSFSFPGNHSYHSKS